MSHEHVQHGDWLATRPATLTGQVGKAWKLEWTPPTVDQTATVVAYLLYAPHVHPIWAYWLVSIVHLRGVPGQTKPAHKRHDDMTHELLVVAMDPNHAPPDPIGWGDVHYLTPIDVIEQIQVPDDAAAARLCELAVRACCDGLLSPDQDFRRLWHETVARTAEHERGEHR